jgi:hypothetical protein
LSQKSQCGLVVPLEPAAGLKKKSDGLSPERLKELGADGGRGSLTLKRGDLVAWPLVLLKRAVE